LTGDSRTAARRPLTSSIFYSAPRSVVGKRGGRALRHNIQKRRRADPDHEHSDRL